MDNQKPNEADSNVSVNEPRVVGDAAYAQLLPEFQALRVEELAAINVDVPSVVTIVVGSLPEVEALLPELQKVAPEIDAAYLNKIRLCALALSYAHARYCSASSPSNELLQMVDAGIALRQTLLDDALPLAGRGLIDKGRLNDMQGAVGFKNVAIDLTILASVFKERWADIQGKCAVSAAEVETALSTAERIFTLVGLKEQGPAAVDSATDMRIRVFTLLDKLWDTVRSAVSFVRWKQRDLEKVAPSLYGQRTRRKGGSDVVVTEPPVPPPGTPGPAAQPAVGGATMPIPTGSHGAAGTPQADPFMPR